MMLTNTLPWRRTALLAAALVTGCAEEPSVPSGPILLGQWGSSEISLTAIRAGAEVDLGCAAIIVDQPVELKADATFHATGRLQTSSAVLGQLPRVAVSGRTVGSQVSLTLPEHGSGALVTYQLEAGVSPPPSERPQCPL